MDVGEGRTSLSREGGSFRSVFQIPVPHAKDDGGAARPITEALECEPHVPGPVSAEGVLGCDAVGDIELLAKEPLRGRLNVCEVSFNQEDRRTGLCCCAAIWAGSWR